MPAPAASQVQYLFAQTGTADERIFNSARVRPRRMFQSQAHQQSGNRYNPGNSNHRQWAELAIEGSLDITDLLLHFIAFAPYKYTTAGGRWDFHAMAGATPTGFTSPKVWKELKAINWADTGPDYTAGAPTLQNLEINFDAGGDSMITAAYLAQEYDNESSVTAEALRAVNPILPLNSDIRVGLSADRLGNLDNPEAVLGARFSWSDIIEPVFGANQDDRGWTDTVESMLTADLRIRFVANDEYLEYDEVDDLVFVTLGDVGNTWGITQLASFREVPNGPGAQQNLQEVELSFLPVARVDGNANTDTVITFTAAAGDSSKKQGYRTASSAFGAVTGTTGYVPPALDRIYWDDDLDKVVVGTADSANTTWPKNWEPESVTPGSATAIKLEYDSDSMTWQSEDDVAAAPGAWSTGASKTATIKWKYTPATYLTAFFTGTSVPNFKA